jgi:glutathione synthase/RimK-type ligase-like ATP-grasp enzyme
VIDNLAWVTTRDARGLDEDEPLALAALKRTGVAVQVVDWDDPRVDWSRFDRVVLRSTWDYPQRLPEFVSWLEHVSQVSELVNPRPAVLWSLDKRYLRDLAEAGVPITPTEFVDAGTEARFPDQEFVVKPAVGAGSRDAASYAADQHDLAAAHVDRLHASGHVALIQPLLESVAAEGEWPLMFFDGEFSHAASKRVTLPRAGAVEDLFSAETNARHVASDAQVEVAQAAVGLVSGKFGTLPYARVDVVRDGVGNFCVLEVELVEPSLFLPHADPGASERFAAAVVRAS